MKRNITIYESAQNGKVTILENVECTKLGTLKQLLRQNNINYNNMDFLEGTTGTLLVNDDSFIPENIPYEGETIHDAVIIMTVKDKKIASGMLPRVELVRAAKPYAEEIREMFGKNFTNVSSAALESFLQQKALEEVEEDDAHPIGQGKVLTLDDLISAVKAFNAVLNTYLEQSKPVTHFSKEEIEGMYNKFRR